MKTKYKEKILKEVGGRQNVTLGEWLFQMTEDFSLPSAESSKGPSTRVLYSRAKRWKEKDIQTFSGWRKLRFSSVRLD